MADDEIERLRDQVFADRLREMREDRAEILAELDTATGEGRGFWERQLEGIDNKIAALAERRAAVMLERKKKQSPPPGPPEQGRLL
ncbi:hypothetical protein [Nocardia yamanashiensis]|uniref:hypothetical protein n=1 Tax=Nocardia yamanashiensis TaxID=209247 RepID=UPI00082A58E4|nr:hypothetical protein [Nocardia yamanashiensis]